VKFQPESMDGLNAVHAYTDQELVIAGQPWRSSVIVPSRGQVTAWEVDALAALTPASFEALLAFDPEVVIFGSGRNLKFVRPALYRCLIERRIGIETMDTQAASRTYNILISEGRRALGAFVIEAH
jgi:uncharacterized protein